jgi:hypothetical protein
MGRPARIQITGTSKIFKFEVYNKLVMVTVLEI